MNTPASTASAITDEQVAAAYTAWCHEAVGKTPQARMRKAIEAALAAPTAQPVIAASDAERTAELLDKVVRLYPFKPGTDGYNALHLARRIVCGYTIEGDPPLSAPTAQPTGQQLADQNERDRQQFNAGRQFEAERVAAQRAAQGNQDD